jgi:hypothetical protein
MPTVLGWTVQREIPEYMTARKGTAMSAHEDLLDYLRAKACKPVKGETDWNARRRKWLRNIAALHKAVRSWLAELENEKLATLRESWATIGEPSFGLFYRVKVLNIMVGNQRVEFLPIGTEIVGAEGRIDVRGRKSRAILALIEGKWELVLNPDKPTERVPLDEESFLSLLTCVME